MTGTVELQYTVQKFSEMILQNGMPSPKNLELLNNLCKELVISQSKPLLEFVDNLIESFMYPRPPTLTLRNLMAERDCAIIDDEDNVRDSTDDIEQVKFELFDLGHPRLLELILLRQKLVELKSANSLQLKPAEYVEKILKKVQKVYLLLVHLLQVLSDHIELATHAKFYRAIVVDSISDFERAFESFKSLDVIFQTLIRNVEQSGKSDIKIFYVDDCLLGLIKDFIGHNTAWYDDIILRSIAFKEYLLIENPPLKNEYALDRTYIETVHEPKFSTFLEKRKLRLRISNRRVF